jgi:hypothetical protein
VTAKALPSVPEIVQKAIANDEVRHQHRLALVCDQIITTERLDASGEVFKKKTVRIVHREDRPADSTASDVSAATAATKDGDTVKAEHRMGEMTCASWRRGSNTRSIPKPWCAGGPATSSRIRPRRTRRRIRPRKR